MLVLPSSSVSASSRAVVAGGAGLPCRARRGEVVCPARRFPTARRAVCGQPGCGRAEVRAWHARPRRRRALGAQHRDLGLEVLGALEGAGTRWRTGGRPPRRARAAGSGWPSRPRGPGTSAQPSPRRVSSTCWPRQARSSSETGRPLQALRTPAIALSRVNGSVAPDRFTTTSCICSTVLNRLPHSGQERRRRIAPPSSATRLSRTRVSVLRQYGQCMSPLPSPVAHVSTGTPSTPRFCPCR